MTPLASRPAVPRRESAYPWVLLGLLMLVSVVSFVDRQVLSVLVDPIRADLGLTDFELGLLSGPAFVCFYIFGNLGAGWLVDRFDRVRIVAGSLVGWSAATVLCGFSNSFPSLFAARGAVGFGEGAIGPAFHSLLADTFDRKRLPMALSIYSMTGSIGPGLAVLFGGLVAGAAPGLLHGVPVIGHLSAWQQTFIIVGFPGVLLAPLLLVALRAPPRPPAQSAAQGLRDYWRGRRLLIVLFVAAIGLLCASELALLLWIPTLLMRLHGYSPADVAATLGPMLIAFGAGGSLLWGFGATLVGRNGAPHAALATMTVAMAVMTPFLFVAPLMDEPVWVLALLVPILICKRAYVGLGHATVQIATPTALRGRVAAIYLACTSAIGALLGPPAIGALTTFVFVDDQAIGVALSTIGGGCALLGAALLAMCIGPYRRAVAAMPTD